MFSSLLVKFVRGGSCTVLQLRATNCFTLLLLLPAAHGCRIIISKQPVKKEHEARDAGKSVIGWDAVHTAVNICLFPPIFFFSGLYYTDVLSTFMAIKAYEHFLQGQNKSSRSASRGFLTFLIGAMALWMRQTNIFWVAVFMGGLELARSFQRTMFFLEAKDASPAKIRGSFNEFVTFIYSGAYHDPSLEMAGASGDLPSLSPKTRLMILDILWCAVILGAATISHPRRVCERLWPYIALLVSFAGFVLWNGGVVLGEH